MLQILVMGSVTAAARIAPNSLKTLDKSLQRFLNKMDERERQRTLSKALSYLRYKQLVVDYQHGLKLTDKALKRLDTLEVNSLSITPMTPWGKLAISLV
mgnify:CR=1 FL=1